MRDQRIRIYALARELGLLPEAVLNAARRLGYKACNQLSILDPRQRAEVEESLRRWPPEEPTGVPSRLRPRGPGPETSRRA
jgi:hypothetical protein